MLNAIGDSLSDLGHWEDKEDGEDEDDDEEDTGHGKLSEDEEPGWVMGTIPKTVQHRMESFRQKQMRLEQLSRLGWGDVADYFGERDMKYRTTELKVPAVLKPVTDSTAVTASMTTFGQHMQALDNVPGQSQMPQVTSRQGSSQMMLGSEKHPADNHTVPPMHATLPEFSELEIAKPIPPLSISPCIWRP